MDWKELFATFANNRALATLLILVNLGGVAFGYYYYYGQFLDTPFYLWPFVPDSPLAVLSFAVFLALHSFLRYQHPALNLLAAVSLIKAGVWSVLVLLLFWPSFFVLRAPFSVMLILLHLGMVLQALVVLSVWKQQVRKEHALLVFAWLLLGDFMDYVVGTVPYPVPFIAGPYFTLLALESVASTLVLFYLARRLGFVEGAARL